MEDLFPEAAQEELEERYASQPKFRPAEVARKLTDRFAHKVTAAVVRKWDNYFLLGGGPRKTRSKGENRSYTEGDIEYFSLIAVLRNMGYSLKDIKEKFSNLHNGVSDRAFAKEVTDRMEKQEKAFRMAKSLLK